MDIVRLVEYIKEWELFDKIDFDQIVSDFNFGKLDNFVFVKNVSDFKNIDKYKKTLFILDKLLIENISNFFDMDNISIIDLNAWLFAYGNKIWISKYDIAGLIKDEFNIFEPIDLFSMLYALDQSGKNYIRISNLDVPTNFVDSKYEDIISLDNKGFNMWNMTIISTWIMFTEVIRLWNFLDEQWIHVKIKILNKLNLDNTNPLNHDENIVFILDILNYEWYENFLKNKLSWKNLNFIYPSYHRLSTILDEYKMEEMEFEALHLADKLFQK